MKIPSTPAEIDHHQTSGPGVRLSMCRAWYALVAAAVCLFYRGDLASFIYVPR